MKASSINTLKYVKLLEEANIPRQQAEAHAEGFGMVFDEYFPSKQDTWEIQQSVQLLDIKVEQLRSDLSKDIAQVRSDLSKDIAQVRSDLSKDIAQVRSDLSKDIAQFQTDLSKDITQVRTDISKDTQLAIQQGMLEMNRMLNRHTGLLSGVIAIAVAILSIYH